MEVTGAAANAAKVTNFLFYVSLPLFMLEMSWSWCCFGGSAPGASHVSEWEEMRNLEIVFSAFYLLSCQASGYGGCRCDHALLWVGGSSIKVNRPLPLKAEVCFNVDLRSNCKVWSFLGHLFGWKSVWGQILWSVIPSSLRLRHCADRWQLRGGTAGLRGQTSIVS